MLPIRDDNPATRFPFVTFLLIAANIAVFFIQMRIQVVQGPDLAEAFVFKYALIPTRDFAHGLHSFRPYIFSMFMHGGLLHVFFNLWTLWIFGDNVESEMGAVRFLAFYLLSGLVAALTHCYLAPVSQVPVVGASGAIAGVMGAYLFLFPRARIRMFTLLVFWPIFFEIPAFVFLIFWFVGQVASGMQMAQMGQAAQDVGGVAFSAHVGGFVAGLLLLPFFKAGRPKRRLATKR